MGSVFLALDPATTANGCLTVLAGSHRMGRLDTKLIGVRYCTMLFYLTVIGERGGDHPAWSGPGAGGGGKEGGR